MSKVDHREINRDKHDDRVEAHAQRMATPEAKKKYAARKHRGERPFAHIKHHFGMRQFLLRGLKKVRIEWTWVVNAFNLQTLMPLRQPRPGPAPQPSTAAPRPPQKKTPPNGWQSGTEHFRARRSRAVLV